MPEKSHRYSTLQISICLAAAIIAVYWPVYNHEFIHYDDNVYVTENINIHQGLNLSSFLWAFSTDHTGNWHPLTWLSLTIDYELFKNWAGGYHLVNVLFHIANTIILFYLFIRMTGALWPSVFVAAAFAIHPLHVESVAWIAERKDVLSAFFWLLTMLAYVKYAEKPNLKWYLTALVLFMLGLMSKPMLVTVPFVLLLLDYWPLERKFSVRLLIEKIPFLICSAASCIVTFLVQKRGGAMEFSEIFGLKIRIYNAVVSYAAYIIKMIWPTRLTLLYPYAVSRLSIVLISGFVLLLLSIIFIYPAKRYRFLAVGWFWYLGTLVPVIGLIQVGAQAMADRYTYMPLIGLFIIIGWGVKEFISKQDNRNAILALLFFAAFVFWPLTAYRQVRYWKDSITLFEHTLSMTENNHVILNNYIIALNKLGRFEEVIEQSEKLLKIKPDSVDGLNNLGIALARKGRNQEALECFKLAIKYDPEHSLSYFNVAVTLQNQDMPAEAAAYYRQVLKIQPNDIGASANLAAALIELNKPQEAEEVCRQALQFEPDNEKLRQLLEEALKKREAVSGE